MRPYLLAKFLQGLIAAFYTWAGLKILPSPAFAVNTAPEGFSIIYGDPVLRAAESLKIAGNSLLIILVIIMLFIIFPVLCRGVKKHGAKKRSPI